MHVPADTPRRVASPAPTWLAAAALSAAVLLVAWAVAGARGPLYLALAAAAMACGLPWGFMLFGRRQAAGWVAGGLFGYGMAGLLWWALAIAAGASSAWCGVALVFVAAMSWLVTRRARSSGVLAPLPDWSARATAALLTTLLLVPLLVGRPFARIGAPGEDGSRRYATYFTADFVWHMALVEELSKRSQPPVDPYLAGEPLHYYWTYFLVPAALTGPPAGYRAAEALALNALSCGLLFLAAIYLGAWVAVPDRPWTAAGAVALVVACGSVEGMAGLVGLQWLGAPLQQIRNVNVDALAAWVFHGLRVDNLPRALWYTPQHAIAFAFGMVALVAAVAEGRLPRRGVLLAGVALALSTACNPFVGAAFCVVFAVAAAVQAWRARAVGILAERGLAAVPVLGAVAWCYATGVVAAGPGAIHVGWWGPATHAPLLTFVVSFFPALLPAVIGAVAGERFWPDSATPALAGVLLSVAVMYTVTLRADPHWVGFRSGHLLFGWLPPLVAVGFVRLQRARRARLARAVIVAVLLLGLPTTVIDAVHAQDVGNNAMGPGFHWSTTLTRPMLEGLDWLRSNTPPDAVVQAEPTVRGRENWSLIPSFAGRRMAAGLPISLLHVPAYDARSGDVRRMFASADPVEAHGIARRLRIDYVWVDALDRAAYGGEAAFDGRPDRFQPVFASGEVTIYAVR